MMFVWLLLKPLTGLIKPFVKFGIVILIVMFLESQTNVNILGPIMDMIIRAIANEVGNQFSL